MSGACESGICEICHKETKSLLRRYYHFDINCDCCVGPRHFEIIRHCPDCTPTEPEEITVTLPVGHMLYDDGGDLKISTKGLSTVTCRVHKKKSEDATNVRLTELIQLEHKRECTVDELLSYCSNVIAGVKDQVYLYIDPKYYDRFKERRIIIPVGPKVAEHIRSSQTRDYNDLTYRKMFMCDYLKDSPVANISFDYKI